MKEEFSTEEIISSLIGIFNTPIAKRKGASFTASDCQEWTEYLNLVLKQIKAIKDKQDKEASKLRSKVIKEVCTYIDAMDAYTRHTFSTDDIKKALK